MNSVRMMKMVVVFLALTVTAQAEELNDKVFLSSCFNSGSGVSFSFSSCLNRNFNQVARDLGGFYSYCSNFGDEVSFSFTSCVNRNFNTAERESQGKIFLRYLLKRWA